MKRILIFALMLVASLISASGSSASDSCKQLNVPAQADDLLTVTMKSISVVEKIGSFQFTIIYEQKNNTSDKKINEGQFKLFFTDGTSTPQYGFFGSFFPGDSGERSYTWEYLKAQVPMVVSYNAGFFAAEPSSSKLNWAPPGQACNLVSPVVKAKQEAEAKAEQEAEAKAKQEAEAKAKQEAEAKAKQEAEAKAKQEAEAKALAERAAAAVDAASKAIDAANKATEAANKAAAEAEAKAKAEAEAKAKAAAELKAKQEAEAKAAAELKAKQEADAKAAAELKAKQEAEAKAAAELKAKQEADAKAAADKVICDANRTQLLSVQASLLTAIKSYPKSATVLNDTRLRLQSALNATCIADVTLNDFRTEVSSVISEAKNLLGAKKTTITCFKGKTVKKVTAVNPKCPSGYKVKK